MDVRILRGDPSPLEAQAIERAFATLEAEARAAAANERNGRPDAWTRSGRLEAHQAAATLARLR